MNFVHKPQFGGLVALLFACSMLFPHQTLAEAQQWLSPNLHEHPLAGVIVDAQGMPVLEAELLSALSAAPYAFIGEKHDNADHHQIEARLIASRLGDRPGSAVVFEMLDDAQRPLLASLAPGDDLGAIKTKLAWPAKGWDFEVYGPLFQASLRDGTLLAGNIGKALIGRLYEQGDSILKGDPRFSTVFSASVETREYLLDRIFEAHCAMRERSTLAPMVSIQLAKDASMADAMASRSNALLIAGGEHVRPDAAVPRHLLTRDQTSKAVVIQLVEVLAGEFDPKSYIASAGPADYYWLTAATEPEDNCAKVTGRAAR